MGRAVRSRVKRRIAERERERERGEPRDPLNRENGEKMSAVCRRVSWALSMSRGGV